MISLGDYSVEKALVLAVPHRVLIGDPETLVAAAPPAPQSADDLWETAVSALGKKMTEDGLEPIDLIVYDLRRSAHYQMRKAGKRMLSEAKDDLENRIGVLSDVEWNRLVALRQSQAEAKTLTTVP